MAQIEYRVVPFIGRIKSSGSAGEVSQQLQSAIGLNTRDGWEFHSLGNVNIEVKPGCLAGLFGAKESYIGFDQLVFQKRS